MLPNAIVARSFRSHEMDGGAIPIAPRRRHGHVSRDVWEYITGALRTAGFRVSSGLPIAAKLRHGHVSRDVWERITGALSSAGVEVVPETKAVGSSVRWSVPRRHRRTAP